MSAIIWGLVFVVLITLSAVMQVHIKEKPQLLMLIFGACTLYAFFRNSRQLPGLIFYVFLTALFYISFYSISTFIIAKISPHHPGWVSGDGLLYKPMNSSWMGGVFFALILSPLTVFFYQRGKQRNRTLEISLVVLFLVITASIYIVKALQ